MLLPRLIARRARRILDHPHHPGDQLRPADRVRPRVRRYRRSARALSQSRHPASLPPSLLSSCPGQ
ncbi:hypothetical protein M3A74_03285 [Corynebacterium appendicis]|uniref:hypothetical protein n=1 Tax=Corynebacterium appendicis TaxID=163202 RepID=UPI00223C365C|nr:hypothetical protein [Corynebacterium appendicis]MCT1683837.1 hypothetical protein [Corynebacterium appendicis]